MVKIPRYSALSDSKARILPIVIHSKPSPAFKLDAGNGDSLSATNFQRFGYFFSSLRSEPHFAYRYLSILFLLCNCGRTYLVDCIVQNRVGQRQICHLAQQMEMGFGVLDDIFPVVGYHIRNHRLFRFQGLGGFSNFRKRCQFDWSNDRRLGKKQNKTFFFF